MSDLAATNCSCSNTDNGCGCSSILWIILLLCCCCGNGNGGSFFGGNNCGSGNNSCIWAIILLFCCGGFGCGGSSNNGCGCGCGCWFTFLLRVFLARSFLRFFGILFLPVLLFFFELFKDFTFALHTVLFDAFFIYLVYVVTIYDKHISFFNNICCKHA